MSKLLYNALQTPDGTIIESKSRHDYVTHKDANGKTYMIDGGLDYVRCSANGDEKHLTITLDDDHASVRHYCKWGTYGINGDQPLSYKKLCDMDTAHIEAVLENVPHIYPALKTAFENELLYREKHDKNLSDRQ
jgi:hypothetical protein